MRALTNSSTLPTFNNYDYPRCFATPEEYGFHIFYNPSPTTGPCGYTSHGGSYKCACQCHTSPPAPPLPPSPPSPPSPPPYAPFAWTTFSSGADCEANGCITPSSQAECEDAMRALTTKSELKGAWPSTYYSRCFTQADSSTPASDTRIFYNTGATTGACGYRGYKCACMCPPSPPAPPPSPPAPPAPPSPPPYAPFAWTTFSSGADCEANGCITPSSQAECEDAMRALTNRSTLRLMNNWYYSYPRCFTWRGGHTWYNSDATILHVDDGAGATTGDCGFGDPPTSCACQCPPDMCECTGDGNQISCSLTGVRYCSSAEECFAPPGTSYPFGQWSDLCRQSRRRLQQSSA